MADLPDWVPEGIEVTVPNEARICDYLLGGYHNFAVDREFVDQLEAMAPGAMALGRANRAFVGRSVRWLVTEAGIRQFLDIGSGIPTLGNVHEVAQAIVPDAKVMYVDIDPIAVAHSQAILAGNPMAGIVRADARHPADILHHPEVTRLLDLSRPVAVLLNAVLHFVPDSADPPGIVAEIREAVVRGSYLSVSHSTDVKERSDEVGEVVTPDAHTPTELHSRGPEQLLAMLAGMEIVPPGVVDVNSWHPEQPDEADGDPPPGLLAVLARKI
ncbi:MAG TPA: SAM-dependent methyltransferase [Pseudonocardiaceae bacterium]|nr:SAM-dependent methyltransferase [Pseudonocardiaceae bacterium]